MAFKTLRPFSEPKMMTTSDLDIYDFKVKAMDGKEISMSEFKNKTLLIVNTATGCGLAPQFDQLENLYQKYQDRGFMVLGFPCAQFANQEKKDGAELVEFCKKNHGVTFPLFARIEVNGSKVEPLFDFLRTQQRGILGTKSIKWNFTKFLVDSNGSVLKRYSPNDEPEKFEQEIVKVLPK